MSTHGPEARDCPELESDPWLRAAAMGAGAEPLQGRLMPFSQLSLTAAPSPDICIPRNKVGLPSQKP